MGHMVPAFQQGVDIRGSLSKLRLGSATRLGSERLWHVPSLRQRNFTEHLRQLGGHFDTSVCKTPKSWSFSAPWIFWT